VRARDVRRLAIALACAVAIHEVAAALIPLQRPIDVGEEPVVAHVTIARIVRTPPPPTPTPVPVHAVAASQVSSGVHARVERIKHAGAKRPTPPKTVYATPDASIPTGGHDAGAQNGQGAGSLSAVNGNGNGTGDRGNGNGATICGAVDFETTGLARYDSATGYYERNITATVYYADGSFEKIPLDWLWRYKSEDEDPFANESLPTRFQFPPLAQRASEPSQVQYIMAHTTPSGGTLLNDQCPNIPAAPGVPSASPQPLEPENFPRWNRAAEVITLHAFAGELVDERELFLRFDAFGDDFQTE
jgi:hypothetical protein